MLELDPIDTLKKHKFAIGWVDFLSNNSDPLVKSLSQNIVDFWSFLYGYCENIPLFYDTNHDDLLLQCRDKDINWLLILSVGLDLRYKNSKDFIEEISSMLDKLKNVAFVGHILDKKDQYYKLHEQAILVNLEWYRKVGCPKFGNPSNIAWETIEPKRSSKNLHDDYTPIWITHGETLKSYCGQEAGWNFIKTALESNAKALVFDKQIRLSKFYFYPTDVSSYPTRISEILRNTFHPPHFLCNTEKPVNCPDNLKSIFDVCLFPAGGINSIMIPWLTKMKKNTEVVVYDRNVIALDMAEKLYKNYKGNSLRDFFEKNTLIDINSRLYCSTETIDQMQEFIDNEIKNGLLDWMQETLPTIKYEFKQVDIFSSVDWYNIFNYENKKIYLNMSNIFNYLQTSRIYSIKNRIEIEKQLRKTLLSQKSNEWFLDYLSFGEVHRKSIEKLVEIKDIRVPDPLLIFPWNK